MIDHLYIFKSDVSDIESFKNSIGLHNCRLINGLYTTEEELYYILEGSPEDVESFRQDWNKQNRIING